MFIHDLDPVLFKLGVLEIRFYGIVYVFGFLLSYYILYKKREKINLSKRQVDNLAFYFLIGLLIGARIFHFLFSDISIFIRNPLELLRVWHGGMSFYGGFIGSLIASYLYLKDKFIDFANVIVVPVSFILILGRIANFINGEIVGVVSNLPWCVVFSSVDNLCRHPYQIYAAISHAILFGSLVIIKKSKFFVFVIGYAFLRILTDFLREDVRFLGLTYWQYVSILVLLVALVWYRKVYISTK